MEGYDAPPQARITRSKCRVCPGRHRSNPPSEGIISFTLLRRHTRTPLLLIMRSSALVMSDALSDCGNTRPPRSTLSFTPASSMRFISVLLSNAA